VTAANITCSPLGRKARTCIVVSNDIANRVDQ
jgi:hypothetical protein